MSIELQRRPGAALAQTLRIRGHELVVDGTLAEGGDDTGPSAHELYDAALAACKALTVLWYARRKGLPVGDVLTEVQSDASQERQGLYRLTARLRIGGELSDAQLAELAAVAEKCPVHKLMTQVRTKVSTQVERLP